MSKIGNLLASGDLDALVLACHETIIHSADRGEKVKAVSALGQVSGERSFYPILLTALSDSDLASEAALSLANIRDSRGLFPLINLYHKYSDNPEFQKRVLQYIHNTGDPRAAQFLQEDVISKGNGFEPIAREALQECLGRADGFAYRFNGSEDMYQRALNSKGRILVSNHELDLNREVIEGEKPKPQTYVISAISKMMFIGGNIHEHVDVAQGEDVLAAGEIEFGRTENGWGVKYINNRSNGYHPEWTSFAWVIRFFQGLEGVCNGHTDVTLEKKQFDETFPVRGYNDPDFLSIQPFGKNYRS